MRACTLCRLKLDQSSELTATRRGKMCERRASARYKDEPKPTLHQLCCFWYSSPLSFRMLGHYADRRLTRILDCCSSSTGSSLLSLATALNEFGLMTTSGDALARARALRHTVESPVLAAKEFDSAFVLMEYFCYLQRDPN